MIHKIRLPVSYETRMVVSRKIRLLIVAHKNRSLLSQGRRLLRTLRTRWLKTCEIHLHIIPTPLSTKRSNRMCIKT